MSLKQDGRVLTARYSDPPLSFATSTFVRELDELTDAVDRDLTIGSVVLTGADGRFLTHADPHELGDMIEKPAPALSMGVLEPGIRALYATLHLPGAASMME